MAAIILLEKAVAGQIRDPGRMTGNPSIETSWRGGLNFTVADDPGIILLDLTTLRAFASVAKLADVDSGLLTGS